MFSEIRQAILPLALRQVKRRNDLERTELLIESLSRHWRDSKPFQLLIVAPWEDMAALRNLPQFPNIEVQVRSEREFFSLMSGFYRMTGWFRQQIVKLYVPAKLGFGGYLTLDSDVACVGDFDATSFVQDGRAMSRWEPKRYHDWWRNACTLVGVPYHPDSHGLSVTPNILHGDLAAQALDFFRIGPIDSMTALSFRVVRKLGTIPWTEYSLYTSVAEHRGNLFDYHLHWDPCYVSDVQLFSEQSCVWGPDDFERLTNAPRSTDPGGKFIIVQSHARIPLEWVREYCLGFAA